MLGPIEQQLLGAQGEAAALVIAESIGERLQDPKGSNVGLLLARIASSGVEGPLDLESSGLGGLFDPDATRQDNQIGDGELLAAS